MSTSAIHISLDWKGRVISSKRWGFVHDRHRCECGRGKTGCACFVDIIMRGSAVADNGNDCYAFSKQYQQRPNSFSLCLFYIIISVDTREFWLLAGGANAIFPGSSL